MQFYSKDVKVKKTTTKQQKYSIMQTAYYVMYAHLLKKIKVADVLL